MSDRKNASTIGHVLHSAIYVTGAVGFYDSTSGLAARRRLQRTSGRRGVALAIAGTLERTASGMVASFRVSEALKPLSQCNLAAAPFVREARGDTHEVRAVAKDPWRQPLYSTVRGSAAAPARVDEVRSTA